jgi:hypothetical protein
MRKKPNLPPEKAFKEVLKTWPTAGFLYWLLWERRQKEGIKIFKDQIRQDYFLTVTLFRNQCMALARLGYIQWEEDKDHFRVIVHEETD